MLSVIVPVYNTAKYIEKCLDALINQTKKDKIEIILINDGSTDNSDEVIKKYISRLDAENKKMLKYYSKENEGIAKTRNYGIEKATSEYVMFVDSDDYIDTQLVEKLEKYMEQKIDLIKFKLQKVDENGKLIEKIDGPVFDETTGEQAFNYLYSKDVLLDSPCVYVIKKELFTKNNFKFKQTYHEDFGLIPLIILSAKTVVSTNFYLYYYVQASNSITRNEDYNKTIKKMKDSLLQYDNMLQKIEQYNLKKRTEENVKIYYTNAIILKLKELKEEDKKFFIHEIKQRRMISNIKVRNLKQLFKKIILVCNIKLYLKLK